MSDEHKPQSGDVYIRGSDIGMMYIIGNIGDKYYRIWTYSNRKAMSTSHEGVDSPEKCLVGADTYVTSLSMEFWQNLEQKVTL